MRRLPLLLSLGLVGAARAGGISGSLELQNRWYMEAPELPEQRKDSISVAATPTYEQAWSDGRVALTTTVFGRIDSADAARTHWDVREASLVSTTDRLEVEVGLGRVYWGVAESVHLVDTINQTDLVESPDFEQKLGQALVRGAVRIPGGAIHLFYLAHTPDRTFPGSGGRLRPPLLVDPQRARHTRPMGRWAPSAAARWELSVSVLDLGLSGFYGTARDPTVQLDSSGTTLVAVYDEAAQGSVDLQCTAGPLLLKHESVARHYPAEHGPEPFIAQVSGGELSLYSLVGSADVGLIAEYSWASRVQSLTPFDDDLFVGARLGVNDVASTSVVAGAFVDRDGVTVGSVEASRRLSDEMTIAVEARLFDAASESAIAIFNRDSYAQIQIRQAL